MIRILIADDQPMIRAGIRAVLDSQEDMAVVGEAVNGRIAVEQVRSLRPDIVLMDVRMPILDGLAATGLCWDPAEARGPSPASSC